MRYTQAGDLELAKKSSRLRGLMLLDAWLPSCIRREGLYAITLIQRAFQIDLEVYRVENSTRGSACT
jgi:hypothetical protein